jgi:nitrogen regulatory protein P-II 1
VVRLISAVVRPRKVDEICAALRQFGVHGFTLSATVGFNRGHGRSEIYRGVACWTECRDQVKIEVIARDDDVPDVMRVIRSVAATGDSGDGTIWVTPIGELVRIRTGEVGGAAL